MAYDCKISHTEGLFSLDSHFWKRGLPAKGYCGVAAIMLVGIVNWWNCTAALPTGEESRCANVMINALSEVFHVATCC